VSSRTPSPRRRGAQPENANALKHGLYTGKRRLFLVRVPGQSLPNHISNPVHLTYREETELLRALFTFIIPRHPDVNRLIKVFPFLRKVINIVFIQAAIVRDNHPLGPADYVSLVTVFEHFTGFSVDPP
jgi:hypothetical protein